MNNAAFLEKLLDGAEVVWLPLSALSDLITTGKLNANAMEDDGAYPFFTCNEHPYKINTYAFDLEAILISGNGSQVGHLNYYKGKFNAYQRTYIIGEFKNNINITYLYHYLKYTLRGYIFQNSRKGSVPYITMPMLENFQIPVPCPDDPKKSLKIQSEIVRILDNFTELTAELTAELAAELIARKKQYNYYRDQLFTFSDDAHVEWKSLGSVIEIKRGKRLVKSQLEETGAYAVYQNSMTPLGYYHESNVESDTAFIICAGAAGEIGYSDVEFWAADDVYICLNPENISSKFIYHCLLNQQNKILAQVRRASIPRLSKTAVEKLEIPIPKQPSK